MRFYTARVICRLIGRPPLVRFTLDCVTSHSTEDYHRPVNFSEMWSLLISMSRPGHERLFPITALSRHLSVTESFVLPLDPRRSIMPSPQLTLADGQCRDTDSQLLQLRRQMLRHARSWPRGSSERSQRRRTAASFRSLSGNKEWLDAHTIFLIREDAHPPVVELADPMKSRETAGWLRGELRAPT